MSDDLDWGTEMSINAINGFNNSVQFGGIQADPIKPETREKLKALGIDEKSVKTETQAQAKINEREEQIKKQINELMQAQASSQQQAQAGSQIQPQQQVQDPNKVDGIKESQQIQQPKGIEQQHSINNQQQQGNEHVKAFAAAHAPHQAQQVQQNQPFELDKDLVAMYNKLKLGLI